MHLKGDKNIIALYKLQRKKVRYVTLSGLNWNKESILINNHQEVYKISLPQKV